MFSVDALLVLDPFEGWLLDCWQLLRVVSAGQGAVVCEAVSGGLGLVLLFITVLITRPLDLWAPILRLLSLTLVNIL